MKRKIRLKLEAWPGSGRRDQPAGGGGPSASVLFSFVSLGPHKEFVTHRHVRLKAWPS